MTGGHRGNERDYPLMVLKIARKAVAQGTIFFLDYSVIKNVFMVNRGILMEQSLHFSNY